MKKAARISVLPILVGIVSLLILVGIGSFIISVLMPESPVKYASRALMVDVPKDSAVIIDKYDGPSFPLGDGYSWTVLQIPSEKMVDFTNSLVTSPDWNRLPLSTELGQDPWCLQPDLADGEIPISTTTGFYLLIDHQEAYNKEHNTHTYDTEIPVCERASQNFLFGVFNEKDGKLYIWSIDT